MLGVDFTFSLALCMTGTATSEDIFKLARMVFLAMFAGWGGAAIFVYLIPEFSA